MLNSVGLLRGVVLSATLSASCTLFGQDAPTIDQMKQTLDVSQRRMQLEMDGSAPFHLVVSYTTYDAKGNPAGTGRLDELWESPTQYQRKWTLPTIHREMSPDGSVHFPEDLKAPPRTLVEVHQGVKSWRTGEWVFDSNVMHGFDAVLRPLILRDAIGDRLTYEVPPAGNAPNTLDCIGTEPDLPGVSPDTRLALTTYCTSRGSHLLRLVELPAGVSLVFDDVQQFDKKYVARTIRIVQNGKLMIRLHVDLLESVSDFSDLDAPAPDGAQNTSYPGPNLPKMSGPHYGSYPMIGQVLKTVNPLYPHDGLSGNIVVKLHVDTAGSVDSAEVVSASNQTLKAPILAAVKGWKFRVSYQGDKVMSSTRFFNINMGGAAEVQ